MRLNLDDTEGQDTEHEPWEETFYLVHGRWPSLVDEDGDERRERVSRND
jgi:hypothetical protein